MQIPHSVETEQAVLAALLMDKSSWYAIEKLKTEDFYNEYHQVMFEAIKHLRNTDKPIDYIQVHEEIKKRGQSDIAYLNTLISTMTFISNMDSYIEILKRQSIRRRIIKECQETINKSLNTEEDPKSIKATLASTLDSIGFEVESESEKLQDIFLKVIEQMENQNPEEAKKYYTGILDLDYLTAGLHKEEVMVIAARPGVGKTAVSLQICRAIASRGLKLLVISREMSKEQMAKRFIISRSKVNSKNLRNGPVEENEWKQIITAMNEMSNLPIYINTRAKTIPEIKAKLRETNADVLIIDYLQLLEPMTKSANREQQVSELSREIKNISLDFKIPVVLLSQLNRQADVRRPTLADLRESGSIEQDANSVVFLHLPCGKELENAVKDKKLTMDFIHRCGKWKRRIVEVIVAKQRDGEVGEFYLEYVPEKLTFLSLDMRRETNE